MVVQLNPETVGNKAFAGCFMIITEEPGECLLALVATCRMPEIEVNEDNYSILGLVQTYNYWAAIGAHHLRTKVYLQPDSRDISILHEYTWLIGLKK